MPDGYHEDAMMRPVLRGLCKYESLKSGAIDWYDIWRMNDALDVQDENERRHQEASEEK